MKKFSYLWSILLIFALIPCSMSAQYVRTGADRLDEYLPLLQGKRVGLVVNQTSVVRSPNDELVPLADTLLRCGVDVRCIIAP